MLKGTTKGKTISVVVVTIGAMIAAFVLVFADQEGGEASPSELPSMTLVYEVFGPAITVGDDEVPTYKEVRRLEYRSKTDWTETVLESPSIDVGRYGTVSNVGAYLSLNGTVLTEYDPLDGTTSKSTIDDGVTVVPNGAFAFAHGPTKPLGDDVAGVAVTTDAHVCFNTGCEDNVGAVRYSTERMSVEVLEGDNWIIPVKLGDLFILRSAEIEAAKP